ncbi:hypothetical protein ABW20_dc0103764 [Dactylellina cionopaga]|nr:hypothetical protein ABW20_dc0103764 [Dactylellina cionopaga]
MKQIVALIVLVHSGHILAALDAASITQQYFGNDAPWYRERIPLFETSDTDLTKVYYYRWNIFRAHQRDLGANGYISTEFLDDVGWQTNPWATINDATGFHLNEGRWCRDRRFKEDYATFMYSSNSNTRQYSECMADAVYKGFLVDGDLTSAANRLSSMQTVFNAWADSFDTSKGLYYVEPLRDATEYTISSIDATGGADGFTGGFAFRPTINSYQIANARAIAALASLKGGLQSTVDTYTSKAAAIKTAFQNNMWNSTYQHFIDRHQVTTSYVKYWDFIRGRELAGYVPWTHDVPDDTSTYAQAWKHILDSNQLAGPHGLRTVEPSYQYYMRQYRYEGSNPECQWNGPVWPYQTSQVLTGLANLLDHYPNQGTVITKADYTRLLQQYAKLHYNPKRSNKLDLQEDYDPATGAPIVGLTRSPHYFHSAYIDNLFTGFVGIRPRSDNVLEVNPLADPSVISWFRADRIIYHGLEIAVQWDSTGSKYGVAGLRVEVDGAVVATSSTLTRLKVNISGKSAPAITKPICKSVQLQVDTAYPKGTVSVSGADVNRVHDAIDGRIWFFPETEVANGWDSPSGGSEVWYQIDFGTSTATRSAEIAFFSDSSLGFDVPSAYRIQVNSGSWKDASSPVYATAVANGITRASWTQVSVNQIRIAFTPKSGKKVRLVEFKVFSELVSDPAPTTTTTSKTTTAATTTSRLTTTTTAAVTTTGIKTTTTTTTSSKTTTAATTATGNGCTAALYFQCGGSGFTGCTVCASGSTCTYSNDWYSQCL